MSHAKKNAIKSDAPNEFIWEMMRAWERLNPAKRDKMDAIGKAILDDSKSSNIKIDFTEHPDADPPSRKAKLKRFQMNPLPNWGPKTKAKIVTDEDGNREVIDKRAKNQGKYSNSAKRKQNQENDESSNKRVNIDEIK